MTVGRPLNAIRYLAGVLVGTVVAVGLAWTYIATFPMAFLPSGYPVWAAKKQMLETCDLGAVMLFGDSQLEAGIVSHGLPLVSTNFSAGGVSPLDAYFLVRQALACPNFPKHAIVSFGVGDYLAIQLAFWSNTIRYGILDGSAVVEIEATARGLHDPSFYDFTTFEGFSGRVRDFLYVHHLPFLYFDSLIRGGFFLRETSNVALFKDTLARRGQMPYRGVQAAPPPDRWNRPPPPGFQPLPVQTEYFERIITSLGRAGISIDFILMPASQTNAARLDADHMERDFIDYLREVAQRHPEFHISQSAVPRWLDRDFIDGVHLNPDGAARFTTLLNNCLRMTDADWQSGTYSRSCEFGSGR